MTGILIVGLFFFQEGLTPQFTEGVAESVGLDQEQRELYVIMYHSIVNKEYEKGPYVITPRQFEEDLNWLKENGYETVVVADLIEFVQGKKDLPKKLIMLTFDDGNYNNMEYALPLLEQYGMKAVISVVGEYADWATQQEEEKGNPSDPNYGYLSWNHIHKLNENPHFEIQNHSYHLHVLDTRQGAGKRKGESESEYIRVLAGDLSDMQHALRENSQVEATAFVYPFGVISKESKDVIKVVGFQSSFSCYEGKNIITRFDPESLYLLKRYNRSGEISSEHFMKKIIE